MIVEVIEDDIFRKTAINSEEQRIDSRKSCRKVSGIQTWTCYNRTKLRETQQNQTSKVTPARDFLK